MTGNRAISVQHDSPSLADRNRFNDLLQSSFSWKKLSNRFFLGCRHKLAPLQAVLGAVAAQEALKAATGLYSPIHQILLYDCEEILEDDDNLGDTVDSLLSSSTKMKMEQARVFLVGAGAIGCEILKNLVAMSVGVNGKIVLTDMDTIEQSNLSRQFLFQDGDLGKFKSMTAMKAGLRMNPNTVIEAHSSKVGEDQQSLTGCSAETSHGKSLVVRKQSKRQNNRSWI